MDFTDLLSGMSKIVGVGAKENGDYLPTDESKDSSTDSDSSESSENSDNTESTEGSESESDSYESESESESHEEEFGSSKKDLQEKNTETHDNLRLAQIIDNIDKSETDYEYSEYEYSYYESESDAEQKRSPGKSKSESTFKPNVKPKMYEYEDIRPPIVFECCEQHKLRMSEDFLDGLSNYALLKITLASMKYHHGKNAPKDPHMDHPIDITLTEISDSKYSPEIEEKA